MKEMIEFVYINGNSDNYLKKIVKSLTQNEPNRGFQFIPLYLFQYFYDKIIVHEDFEYVFLFMFLFLLRDISIFKTQYPCEKT